MVIQGIRKIRTKPISDYYSSLLYYKEKINEIKGKSIKAKKEKINLWYEPSLRLPIC